MPNQRHGDLIVDEVPGLIHALRRPARVLRLKVRADEGLGCAGKDGEDDDPPDMAQRHHLVPMTPLAGSHSRYLTSRVKRLTMDVK